MNLADAAARLDALLAGSAPLWRPAPFHDDPPWVHQLPALAGSLLSTPEAHLDTLEADAGALAAFLSPVLPEAGAALSAAGACLGDEPRSPLPADDCEARDVPGRKWQQARHFAAYCEPGPARRLVDWCCGKAHLGRLLAGTHDLPVTGIERDPALGDEGNRLAARAGLPVTIRQADALATDAATAGLGPGSHAVALHACGELHTRLLALGQAAGTDGFTVAPCCFHLTREPRWQPMSAALAGGALAGAGLTRDDLRLAVQETATAPARVIRQSRQLAAWRLGFDRLQRDLRGVDAYLPTPSRPARVLADGFPAFCRDMAGHHGLPLPAGITFDAYEQAGADRLQRVRRLELLRHGFRRPLEVLLVADRALYLAAHGYAVRIVSFCPRRLTPRNLAILATRTAGHPSA